MDDNFANIYGFATANPGYSMYRGPGKQFDKGKALIYCRGCKSIYYLSHIEFDENFPEQDLFQKIKHWKGNKKQIERKINAMI